MFDQAKQILSTAIAVLVVVLLLLVAKAIFGSWDAVGVAAGGALKAVIDVVKAIFTTIFPHGA